MDPANGQVLTRARIAERNRAISQLVARGLLERFLHVENLSLLAAGKPFLRFTNFSTAAAVGMTVDGRFLE